MLDRRILIAVLVVSFIGVSGVCIIDAKVVQIKAPTDGFCINKVTGAVVMQLTTNGFVKSCNAQQLGIDLGSLQHLAQADQQATNVSDFVDDPAAVSPPQPTPTFCVNKTTGAMRLQLLKNGVTAPCHPAELTVTLEALDGLAVPVLPTPTPGSTPSNVTDSTGTVIGPVVGTQEIGNTTYTFVGLSLPNGIGVALPVTTNGFIDIPVSGMGTPVAYYNDSKCQTTPLIQIETPQVINGASYELALNEENGILGPFIFLVGNGSGEITQLQYAAPPVGAQSAIAKEDLNVAGASCTSLFAGTGVSETLPEAGPLQTFDLSIYTPPFTIP